MKGKKQKEKKNKTTKEIISEVRNEFKDEESKYQILGNAGGDYIKTKLPKNFYEDITTGEMSLEYDFSIEKLTKLMDLYSLGIQYFLENNPTQAKAFQDRMGFILTNKDTLFNLKRQQAQEQREKEEKEKEENNKSEQKEEKNNKKEIAAKSAKNLPKTSMRKRAKTNFMMKSQNIKDEEIQRKVTFVLKNDKIKEDKENVKNIIKEDINKQNLKWKEKLKNKRSNMNNTSFGLGIRPRHRTFFIKMKKFQTPGPIQGRGVMVLKSPTSTKSPNQNNLKSDFKENHKPNNNVFTNFIDIESSEVDQEEKNEGDIDFLKNFKEKHNWKEEDNKSGKNDEKKDHDEENEESDSDSDSDSSGTLNSDEFLKKIDEVDEEEEKRKEALSMRKTSKLKESNNKNRERKTSEFNIEDPNHKDGDKKVESNTKEKEKDDANEISISTQTTEVKNENPGLKRKVSIVEEINLLRNIDPDEEIINIIEEKMKPLNNLDNIKNIISKDEEETNDGLINDEINSTSNNNLNPTQDQKLTIDDIPLKFQDTYSDVEEKMKNYVKELNDHFYKDTFELFSLELKELYDKKYNKYIEVNNEYHNNIKEKEYQLENDENINEEKKVEIQQIIDSLKEEQKDQIDKITDEYNELIDKKIAEFKQTFFKKDCGINLMEEQLKLDIYTMINEAFY